MGRLSDSASRSLPWEPNALPFAAGFCPDASAACSWARLAGLPEREPFFLALPFLAVPPRPMPGIPPGMPGTPCPEARRFIIFWAWAKRSMSWLTSDTVTPEPRAMRARREPLSRSGWRRSFFVIELMIAIIRGTSLPVTWFLSLIHI